MNTRVKTFLRSRRLRKYLAFAALYIVLQVAACYLFDHLIIQHLGMLDDHGPLKCRVIPTTSR
jgi:hypothetical protein